MNAAPLSPEDPVRLGDFELLGRIGHGGMGQVYLGESPGGEPAAVKVIKPAVVDAETRLRFAQEVEVLKTVSGACIATFMDADPETDQPWLATEYVDGPDLRRHVTDCGPLPTALVASLGANLAYALSGVHKQGLLHRDLKPANILLGPNGPKIIDFGLAVFTESSASLTAPHTVLGTPACMAPEQANGIKPLLAPVDVYALGAVLLYAATGHYPFQAENIHALFHLITQADAQPDLTGAPDSLAPLLTAMLAHDANARPTLQGVVQQCRTVIESEGLTVAQARRRLTAHTAASRSTAPPLPVPPPQGPAPADLPTATAPRPPDAPAPAPSPSATAPAPAPYTPTVRVPTARRPGTHRVGHSAQARRVAQQLRETYAQRAKF